MRYNHLKEWEDTVDKEFKKFLDAMEKIKEVIDELQ